MRLRGLGRLMRLRGLGNSGRQGGVEGLEGTRGASRGTGLTWRRLVHPGVVREHIL